MRLVGCSKLFKALVAKVENWANASNSVIKDGGNVSPGTNKDVVSLKMDSFAEQYTNQEGEYKSFLAELQNLASQLGDGGHEYASVASKRVPSSKLSLES